MKAQNNETTQIILSCLNEDTDSHMAIENILRQLETRELLLNTA